MDLGGEGSEESLDALLNEGLKSNGPFYGLGARLSQAIVDGGGSHALGEALAAGAPSFFHSALDADPTLAERLPERLREALDRL